MDQGQARQRGREQEEGCELGPSEREEEEEGGYGLGLGERDGKLQVNKRKGFLQLVPKLLPIA